MDKKTVYGLVLMGLILTVFSVISQPSAEELKKQEEKNKKELALQKEEAKKEKAEKTQDKVVSENKGARISNSISIEKGELIRLENKKMIVDFSTQGGKVAAVYLKGFETYSNYAKGDKAIKPMRLFLDGDAKNELVFPLNGKKFKTGNLKFDVKSKTKNAITFEIHPADKQAILYTYRLKEDAYDLDYAIHLEGFQGKTTPQNVQFKWETAYRLTERLFSEQRRVSTVCYKYSTNGVDNLSEVADDYSEAEDKIDWIAFKQSYFSSILRPMNGFAKEGSTFKVKNYKEGDKKYFNHLKEFTVLANLNISNTGSADVKMNWFFGPNDYKTLKSYDQNYDDILNYGWGLFRWINLYAVQPIFELFGSTGMGLGWAILLLTIVLKVVLMPIQWKMFVSSVKMKILKPEIEELNKKFPNKEDAMKKQVEMMSLYKESGASPLAGCIPMLIQMPILLAVFRFFPATFGLRQKPFLWAEDLSSYDSIWDFGVNIWPYGDHMSLFTILMAATTIVYTFINSGNMQQPQQPGMPNMKVIMYIFPVMMIFVFNNYSSGLSYYYFISTLISIIIMLLIKQFFVDETKLREKMAARKMANQTTVKKKSKFQERLEAMQAAQKQQMEMRKKK
ncbi:MAG: membrane protein insertase YidC [Flavobacteriia bacterium]|nr:membrane protein insertase YidC [Flavobacteriia bacterium]